MKTVISGQAAIYGWLALGNVVEGDYTLIYTHCHFTKLLCRQSMYVYSNSLVKTCVRVLRGFEYCMRIVLDEYYYLYKLFIKHLNAKNVKLVSLKVLFVYYLFNKNLFY